MPAQHQVKCEAVNLSCDSQSSQSYSCQDNVSLQSADVLPNFVNSELPLTPDVSSVHSLTSDVRQMYIKKMLDVKDDILSVYESLDPATMMYVEDVMESTLLLLDLI